MSLELSAQHAGRKTMNRSGLVGQKLPPVLHPLFDYIVNNPLPLVLPTFSLTPPTTPLPPALSPLQLRSHPLPITYPTTLLPSSPITITHPLPLVLTPVLSLLQLHSQ